MKWRKENAEFARLEFPIRSWEVPVSGLDAETKFPGRNFHGFFPHFRANVAIIP
jgi:hypothetical protein